MVPPTLAVVMSPAVDVAGRQDVDTSDLGLGMEAMVAASTLRSLGGALGSGGVVWVAAGASHALGCNLGSGVAAWVAAGAS